MDFKVKLNKIFLVLNCSNTALAHVSKIDPSYISRLRTGTRVPRAESSQFQKLCRGIALFVSEKSLVDKLRASCALDNENSLEEEIRFYLINKPVKKKADKNKRASKNMNFQFFGQKLNALMNMFEVSNIRLAKALNVDTSLISRFRNGLRTPPENNQLTYNLCAYFYKKAIELNMTTALAELLCLSKQAVLDGDGFISVFAEWICGKPEIVSNQMMDSLLERLSLGLSDTNQISPIESIIAKERLNERKKIYLGINGLKKAVLRLLCEIAMSEKPCIIKLYFDHGFEWLTSDPVYTQECTSLMLASLKKNHKIHIIHHIDRTCNEMLTAIEKWMPFYMTGMLRSFCCNKTGDGKFANSFFIAPGIGSVTANLVLGTEDSGRYYYSDLSEDISYYETQFSSLMHMSKPLVQVFNCDYTSEYFLFTNEMAAKPGETKRLLTNLSVETMPKPLLVKMLISNGITGTEAEKILLLYDYRKNKFRTELESGGVTELSPFSNISELLSHNSKLSLASLFIDRELEYTPEHYIGHLESIIAILKENDKYKIVPLKERIFHNIQMAVKENAGSVVLKIDSYPAAYWFGNPAMCTSFNKYIESACCNHYIGVTKENIIRWLESLISEINRSKDVYEKTVLELSL